MRLRLPIALVSILGLALFACDSGGGGTGTAIPGTTTTPGAQETAFDDFFSAGGGLDSNEQTGASGCAAGEPGCEDPRDPNTPDPNPIDPIDLGLPECSAQLAIPSSATGACTPLCQKIAECRDDTSLLTACVADCADSLRGMEIIPVEDIFDCFVAASCEALADWGRGGSVGGEPTRVPDPTPGGNNTPNPDPGPDSGGDSDSSDAQPIPDGGDGSDGGGGSDTPDPSDYYDTSGDSDANPIGECMQGLFIDWSTQTLPSAKMAVCESTIALEDECTGDDVVVSGSGSSGSSSSGEVPPNSTPSDGGSDSPDGADRAPMPPEYEYEEDDVDHHERELAECKTVAGMLTQQVLNRIDACYNKTDCNERDECIEGVLACVPFLPTIIYGMARGDSGSVTVDVSEPPQPTDPTEPNAPDSSPPSE